MGFLLEDLEMPILYKAHKAVGFIVLLLAIARLLWRLTNKVPEYNNLPKWMASLAHCFHYGFYALMIIMPLSAFISSNAAQYPVSFLFLFDMPSLFATKNIELSKDFMDIHKLLAVVLVIAISMHILVGLYHHFIRKDNILVRMLPDVFGIKKRR